MKKSFSLMVFFLLTVYSFSTDNSYDSLYKITVSELIYAQPDQALLNTEHLFKISRTIEEQTQSLLLRAELLRVSGIGDKAIEILLFADSITTLTKDYKQGALINGMLATNYRESNLLSIGNKYLAKAMGLADSILENNERYRLNISIAQETAYMRLAEGAYEKAIAVLLKSNADLAELPDSLSLNKSFNYALNNQIIAENFEYLGITDSSFYYNQKALEFLDSSNSFHSSLEGFIYCGLGNTHLLLENYEEAEADYNRAMVIAENSNIFKLKKEVYKGLIACYKQSNKMDEYIAFNEKLLLLIEQEQKRRRAIGDKVFDDLYEEADGASRKDNENKESKETPSYMVLVLIGGLVVLPFSIITFYKRSKFKTSEIVIVDPIEGDLARYNKKNIAKKEYMSQETEDSIYKNLLEIEETEYYLKENVSLSFLSSKMGVNQRYLSYVVKNKMDKDFTTYINELRINYIIKYLHQDSKHLNYKISYLAEKAGFSSHSRFTINFKKVTGINPSDYIHNIQENRISKKKRDD